MPGSINVLHTFPTVDSALADSTARGMSFKSPTDGNIYLAVIGNAFLGLNKTTGAVVFATFANDLQFKTNWNAASNSFLNASAGGAPHFDLARFDGAGNLIDNPVTGPNPYGAIISNGKYFAGNTGDNFVTVLDAASGAPVTQIDTTVLGPTTGVGQWAADGVSIWCSAINAFLIQINPGSNGLLNVYDLTLQGVGRIAGLVFIAGFLYISDRFTGNIWRVNPATGIVNGSFSAGFSGYLTFDGTYVWMLDPISNAAIVYSFPALVLQAAFVTPASAQDLAFDPADGPGIVWVTSGGPPSQVRQLQFVPFAPPPGTAGLFHGTYVGFTAPGQCGGGTK